MVKVHIPVEDGKSGNWEVQSFSVSEEAAKTYNISASWKPGFRVIHPGSYKRLMVKNKIMMSNTPAEISDHLSFMYRATGDVIINGLGLGMCIFGILAKKEINSITVIEKELDVINLIEPYIKDSRVTIIHDDAFTWKPPKGVRYNVAWHDIWQDICADNIEEMTKLKRKYGRRCDWQGCWCEYLCKQAKLNDKRRYW